MSKKEPKIIYVVLASPTITPSVAQQIESMFKTETQESNFKWGPVVNVYVISAHDILNQHVASCQFYDDANQTNQIHSSSDAVVSSSLSKIEQKNEEQQSNRRIWPFLKREFLINDFNKCAFRSIIVSGQRRVGKTMLLLMNRPTAVYINFRQM